MKIRALVTIAKIGSSCALNLHGRMDWADVVPSPSPLSAVACLSDPLAPEAIRPDWYPE